MMTNELRRTPEIKCRIVMAKAALNKEKTLHHQIELKFKEESRKVLYLDRSCVWC